MRKRKPLPRQDLLNTKFKISKNKLIYKKLPEDFYGPSVKQKAAVFLFNADVAGSVVGVGWYNGYKAISIKGQSYLLHRIIWKMVHGTEPVEVDHIDGDTSNNRVENLRSASDGENKRNIRLSSANKSGQMGVRLAESGRYTAGIGNNGNNLHLGTFDTFEEAKQVRKAAEAKLSYHKNHGRPIVEFSGDYIQDRDSPVYQKKFKRARRKRLGYR